MAKRENKQSDVPERIVYVIRGKRPADRLGTVTATDSDTAIAKAIEAFGITDPERQRRVIVRPIAESQRCCAPLHASPDFYCWLANALRLSHLSVYLLEDFILCFIRAYECNVVPLAPQLHVFWIARAS
jgi:hypothetical protein